MLSTAIFLATLATAAVAAPTYSYDSNKSYPDCKNYVSLRLFAPPACRIIPALRFTPPTSSSQRRSIIPCGVVMASLPYGYEDGQSCIAKDGNYGTSDKPKYGYDAPKTYDAPPKTYDSHTSSRRRDIPIPSKYGYDGHKDYKVVIDYYKHDDSKYDDHSYATKKYDDHSYDTKKYDDHYEAKKYGYLVAAAGYTAPSTYDTFKYEDHKVAVDYHKHDGSKYDAKKYDTKKYGYLVAAAGCSAPPTYDTYDHKDNDNKYGYDDKYDIKKYDDHKHGYDNDSDTFYPLPPAVVGQLTNSDRMRSSGYPKSDSGIIQAISGSRSIATSPLGITDLVSFRRGGPEPPLQRDLLRGSAPPNLDWDLLATESLFYE
ncbi:hypothetical protein BDK51DRAFT_50037 [Blyttiomyces helicus]|uniref:Uncharacterized protein n=1 Tax=Blyttiomyces helicus TaxID=388810 RepID=A0A4P9W4H9_9FUNG|nr:hypothetical protein BDK51DRAFT_50037 [Blyttiomyces helicus]|eukprot:RKO86155.1 hypothetical protein BDK51DRAFT_50037 [Blyttiomyces helicus]